MSSKDHPFTREEAYQKFREDPEAFFDVVWHKKAESDGDLIDREWPAYWTKYHYNLVENGILEVLHNRDMIDSELSVLDVGCGTGHWVKFYDEILCASKIVGADFSQIAVDSLASSVPENTSVFRWDITKPTPGSIGESRYNVVNAIGVLFHVVDDHAWITALKSLKSLLAEGGVIVIGGDFGEKTIERGVMRKSRSLSDWQDALNKTGLTQIDLKRFDWWGGASQGLLTDNLMFVERNK